VKVVIIWLEGEQAEDATPDRDLIISVDHAGDLQTRGVA